MSVEVVFAAGDSPGGGDEPPSGPVSPPLVGGPPGRAVPVVAGRRVLLLAGGAAVGALLVAAALAGLGDGPLPAGLADPGAIARRGEPIARVAGDLAATGTVGGLLAVAALLPGRRGDSLSPVSLRVMHGVGTWVRCWLAASVAALVLMWSSAAALPPWRLAGSSPDVLLSLPAARALLLTICLCAGVGAQAGVVRTRSGATPLLLLGVVALVPPLLTGHEERAGQTGLVATVLVVHVLTAVLWAGGLLAVAVHLRHERDLLPAVGRRLSAVALPCSLALAGSGVLVALSHDAVTLSTGAGRLVAGKAGLLVVLLLLGARQRLRALPGLASGHPGAFLRLCGLEVTLLAAALTLAAVLSRTH